ncbi:hypothetical protein DUNSADRAFT_2821 [Dunaliella salina]|uniref:TIR domain-containing protein n=1 Tax=Dunaliella salina TaxID=3046 RepID=A0ABQ7FVY9_DUNSA|nr:hypothetical protein DUNSADRAFT_2821 [Dunaliella salina]|eukprot:KAF5826529.1 hypothetical protein DUNSADRAFT_2821 [Dunaliella salina]
MGRLEVVKLLLDRGADMDMADEDGHTPLWQACYGGRLEVVKLLLDRGADMDMADKARCTAAPFPSAPPPASVSSARPDGQQATRTAAPSPAAPPSASVSNTRPTGQRKANVFISFRVKEAQTEAVALKRALEAENIPTFCSSMDIPEGADWVRTITAALHAAQLVVVLATPTYGSPGTDSFATAEELSYAKRKKKMLYVVPMAEEWEDPTTDVLLGMIQKGAEAPQDGPGNEEATSSTVAELARAKSMDPVVCTVGIVGGVTPGHVWKLAKKYWAGWKEPYANTAASSPSLQAPQSLMVSATAAAAAADVLPGSFAESTIPGSCLRQAAQTGLKQGSAALYKVQKGCPVLQVACELLSGSRTSRLATQLVLPQRLVSASAITSYPGEKHAGLTLATGVPREGSSPEECEKLLKERLEQLSSSAPSHDVRMVAERTFYPDNVFVGLVSRK